MPLIEVATVHLHSTLGSEIPASFTQTWEHAVHLATTAAGIPFRLYQLTSDSKTYCLFGGWRTKADHVGFLSTSDAIELAKSIGRYMTVENVRHIEGDIGGLKGWDQSSTTNPKLKVEIYKVLDAEAGTWERNWPSSRFGAGGWDASASVQKRHKAFRAIGEATNSASAFGDKDEDGKRTWVWVSGVGTNDSEGLVERGTAEHVGQEVFEMEYVLG